jgi:hypothetical protein
MKYICFIIPILFLSSCDQTGLGITMALKNVVLSPLNTVSAIFSDNQFEKNKVATTKQSEAEEEEVLKSYCLDENNRPLSVNNIDQILGLKENIRQTACQCTSWGDCPEGICSCHILCPEGFEIFKHPSGMTCKKLSQEKNSLAFRNDSIPSKHQQTQGYCWGHARMTSQFNRLAFFKPNNTPPYNLNSTSLEEQNKAIEFYKVLIDKVSKNEAVDIPGFPDLMSLSEHPAFQSYIGDKVAKSWADNAMSWQGLSSGFGSSKLSNEKYTKVFKDIKERIDMNMQPTIVFTSRGTNFYTHSVLVSHYEEFQDGSIKLCLRDNNNPESNSSACIDSMTIDPQNGLMYSDWGEIGSIRLAHNENPDANAQVASLKEKCKKERKCP